MSLKNYLPRTCRFKFGPEIIIERHLRSARKNSNVDFFNMYIRNEDDFSKQTTGFLGNVILKRVVFGTYLR